MAGKIETFYLHFKSISLCKFKWSYKFEPIIIADMESIFLFCVISYKKNQHNYNLKLHRKALAKNVPIVTVQ